MIVAGGGALQYWERERLYDVCVILMLYVRLTCVFGLGSEKKIKKEK